MRFLICTEEDRARAAEHVSLLKLNGERRYVFDCKAYRRPRSNQQNHLLWLWLGVIESETGNTRDDVHEWCKRKFLEARTIEVGGEKMRIPGSTRGLDTKQFTDYLDKIQQWAGDDLGIVLPDPSMRGYDAMVAHFGGA